MSSQLVEIKNKLYQSISIMFMKDGSAVTFGPRKTKIIEADKIDFNLLNKIKTSRARPIRYSYVK